MKFGHVASREARARFADLIDDAEHGNVTLVTRHGRPAAAIVPAALLEQFRDAMDIPAAVPLRPGAGPALAAAVAGLRDALHTLEPLLGETGAPPAAVRTRYQARPGRRVLVVTDLADLRGPASGTVTLPLRLFWSPPGHEFDLSKPFMLQSMYQTVLGEAIRPDELTTYLNGDTLAAVWRDLFLPRGVRQAWEEYHPVLRIASAA
jgi:prevent-host-death family protein